MKKKLISIGIVVITVIVIFAFSNNKQANTNTTNNNIEKTSNLNFADGVKCIQTNVVGQNNSLTNTMYFYQEKMRYDTQLGIEKQGQKDMHVISDGKKSYVWGKGAPTAALGSNESIGVIMDAENDSAGTPVTLKDIKTAGVNGIPGLKCEEWNPEMNVFELPEDIQFMTMEEMMNPQNMIKNTMEPSTVNEVDCSVCDAIPDATAKKSCLDSLGCK